MNSPRTIKNTENYSADRTNLQASSYYSTNVATALAVRALKLEVIPHMAICHKNCTSSKNPFTGERSFDIWQCATRIVCHWKIFLLENDTIYRLAQSKI